MILAKGLRVRRVKMACKVGVRGGDYRVFQHGVMKSTLCDSLAVLFFSSSEAN